MVDTKKEAKELLYVLEDLPEEEKIDCISEFLDDLITDAIDEWADDRVDKLNEVIEITRSIIGA